MMFAGITNRDFFIILLIMATPCNILLFTFYCCYLFLLHRTLAAVKPHNRWMHPYGVWLLLVPGVHVVWYFGVVFLLAKSLISELRGRGESVAEWSFGKHAAIAGGLMNLSWLAMLVGHAMIRPGKDVFDEDYVMFFSIVVVAFNLLAMFVHFLITLAAKQNL